MVADQLEGTVGGRDCTYHTENKRIEEDESVDSARSWPGPRRPVGVVANPTVSANNYCLSRSLDLSQPVLCSLNFQ